MYTTKKLSQALRSALPTRGVKSAAVLTVVGALGIGVAFAGAGGSTAPVKVDLAHGTATTHDPAHAAQGGSFPSPTHAKNAKKAANAKTAGNAKTAANTVYLAANLNGREEVPVPDGPAVGDPNGEAQAVVRVQGDQMCFTTLWDRIGAPTAAHIHTGAAGANGTVKVAFFASALPETITAVTGCVTVDDPAALRDIVTNPGGHYVNLHTAEFPGGAVRGQLYRLDQAVDLLQLFRGPLVSLADGAQEVPNLGDPDGRATGFVNAQGDRVVFAATWNAIDAPTLGHLHKGQMGQAGDPVVVLFAASEGLPASLSGVAGVVSKVDPKVTGRISQRPDDYYLNLHTKDFAKGSVRGQLFRAG